MVKMNNIYNCTGHIIKVPHIVNSDGAYLFDDKGKKYIDLESGVWCTSIGHNNFQINKVIKKQIGSLLHAGFCYTNNIVQEAAEKVLSISGFIGGKCVFLSSGSESIELARQISKHVTGKKISMTLHDSYLGSYSSVTDRNENWYLFNWEKCRQCPDQTNCKANCPELLKIPTNVSEFIFEPGSSSGFVRFPPKSLIKNIVTAVRESGGKIIANEVTTGIGRTGKWFGFNHYPIEPDMIAMGKGIGNGYPVSITAINQHTIDHLDKSDFKYSQSHQNDPLGAAIVNEVIQIINDGDLISKAKVKGDKFFKKLQLLKDDARVIDVRGQGLMFAIDLCDEKTGDRIYQKLLDKGYIVCNRKSLFRIDPPLTINEDDFSEFINDFKNILNLK